MTGFPGRKEGEGNPALVTAGPGLGEFLEHSIKEGAFEPMFGRKVEEVTVRREFGKVGKILEGWSVNEGVGPCGAGK